MHSNKALLREFRSFAAVPACKPTDRKCCWRLKPFSAPLIYLRQQYPQCQSHRLKYTLGIAPCAIWYAPLFANEERGVPAIHGADYCTVKLHTWSVFVVVAATNSP